MKFQTTIIAATASLAILQAAPADAKDAKPTVAVEAQNPTSRDLDIAFPFRVGPVFAGDLGVRILRSGEILLPAEPLIRLASPYLSAEGMNLLSSVPSEGGFQSLRRLREAGLEIFYEPQRLEILLLPNADQAASTDLSLAWHQGGAVEPTPSEGLSGFVNLYSTFTADYEGEEPILDRGNLRTLMDGALHYRGFTLEGEASLDEAQGFRRLGTRLVHDDLTNLLRYQVGDVVAGTTGFQTSEDLLGVSVTRSFTVLRPGRSVRSTGAQSFRLDQPSSVDVYVNGALRRSLDLQPGDYRLDDLGFNAGGNEVRLEIEDDSGRRETLDFTLFFDSSLLAEGLTEFGFAAGVRSELESDERRYFDDEPVVSGYARHGVSDLVTLGVNAQGDKTGGVLGGEATFATPFGAFSLDGAYSREWGGNDGYAIDLDYEISRFRLYDDDDVNRRLALSIEYQSDDFAALGGTRQSDADLRFAGSYSQDILDDYRLALAGSYELGGRGSGNRSDFSATLSGPLPFGDATFAASLGYSDGYSDFGGIYGLLSLNVDLGPGRYASSSYGSRDNRVQANYVSTTPEEIGAIDYNLRAIRDDDANSLSGSLRYTANRFEVQVDHDAATGTDLDGLTTNRTTLRANTALVFAGNRFALSRPVNEGFAIVDLHSTIADKDLVIDPTSGLKRYASDGLGPAVLNDLAAYSTRRIAVDVEDLPVGYDLGAGAFDVTPYYKAGYAFTVGSEYSVTMVATALDRDGEPVSLLSGIAREAGDDAREPIQVFTNRSGRLVAQGLRPGRWLIELGGSADLRYLVDVADGAEGIVRLGEISPKGVE